jgi:hypothetical protein
MVGEKMNLEEAIEHCLDVAEQNEREAEVYDLLAKSHNNSYEKLTASRFYADCTECATEYRQFAEWLTELKELQEENKILTSKCNSLIKENSELNELKEKTVLRICQREARLKEAKELLKFALADFREIKPYLSEPYSHLCDKWRYEDEALKLINS